MSSPDPESHPGETSPLLGSTRSEHEEEPEETTEQRQGVPVDREWLSLWFYAALFTGVVAAAFLLTEWLMASYGWEWFRYREWAMEHFREKMFWGLLVSIVFNTANLVRLRVTRKPLPAFLNAVFLGILTLVFIVSVADAVEGRTWSLPIYCKREPDENPYPGYPDDPNRKGPGSQEDCLKWAPKMQAIVLLLIVFAGFHAMFLGRLFIAVLEELFSITSRYFRGNNSGSRPSPSQISFQVSLSWGQPAQQSAIENQPRQESTPAE